MSNDPVILWFRQDLRLADNPALAAAAETGRPVLPVYILDDETPGAWRAGGASRWWLHHSLEALGRDLRSKGTPLLLRRGGAEEVIAGLAAETGASTVYWNRCYEPFAIERDKALKADLKERGVTVKSFNANLLFEPWTVETQSGEPYKVFTPFYKACLELPQPGPALDAPKTIAGMADPPSGDALDSWRLLPTKPDWAGGLRESWSPGEAGARERAADFLDGAIDDYKARRDYPGDAYTSRLSPHLHFGEVGPRQLWHAADRRTRGGEAFARELVWREFAYHLLYHRPDLPERPLRPEFADFPWRDDQAGLAAWQRGRTGYPLVDAGMRELWRTGWMHNRVRMVAASFLVKDLLISWQEGEAWFWDTLVDADLANNSAGWQWVAGCGTDAAPYFRIFNPVTQSEKFDPDGAYIRRFVPELAGLPDKHIHAPWQAPDEVLREAGVTLGEDYPEPIVEHGAARQRALEAFDAIKRG